MDENDRPIASFLWPGNTADVTTLLPVIERLRSHFGVRRCRARPHAAVGGSPSSSPRRPSVAPPWPSKYSEVVSKEATDSAPNSDLR